MEYQTLFTNDNGTARVRMDIGGHILEQDFPFFETEEEFKASVEQGMAVFNAELERNVPEPAPAAVTNLVGTTQTVTELPEL